MAQFKGKKKSACGFIIIISVSIFIFGFGSYASADRNEKCYQAVVALERVMREGIVDNRSCMKSLGALFKKMNKSAKRYKANESAIDKFMIDERISKKEATKIQKMADKSTLLSSTYEEIQVKAENCRKEINDDFVKAYGDASRICRLGF